MAGLWVFLSAWALSLPYHRRHLAVSWALFIASVTIGCAFGWVLRHAR